MSSRIYLPKILRAARAAHAKTVSLSEASAAAAEREKTITSWIKNWNTTRKSVHAHIIADEPMFISSYGVSGRYSRDRIIEYAESLGFRVIKCGSSDKYKFTPTDHNDEVGNLPSFESVLTRAADAANEICRQQNQLNADLQLWQQIKTAAGSLVTSGHVHVPKQYSAAIQSILQTHGVASTITVSESTDTIHLPA